MQSNDTNTTSLSLRDKLRLLRKVHPQLRDDEDAQRLYEQNQSHLSSPAPRRLSSLSALSASSSHTFASISNHSVSDGLTWTIEAPPLAAASQTRNDIAFHQPSQELGRYLGQQWDTLLFIDKGRRTRTPTTRGSSSRGRTPLPSPLECPLCAVVGLVESFKRQSEFTRHLITKHPKNEVYICPHQRCSLAFDRRWSFNEHCRKVHRGAVNSSEVAPTKLQTQKVLACGFSICKYILEADSDEDAEEKHNGFISHISDHLKEDPKLKKVPKPEWDYAHYLKNLMHQNGLKDLWKSRERANPGIKWQPQPHNSYVLRKMVETRCYYNAALLVECVDAVGYPPYNKPDSPAFPLPPGLSRPLEINFSGDSVQNVGQVQPDDPSHLSENTLISRATPTISHDGYPVLFPNMNDSDVTASQSTEKVQSQSYNLNISYSDSASLLSHSHPSQVITGAYQGPPTLLGVPMAHQPSQDPNMPQDWNSAAYFPPEYQDDLIDPRILAPNNYPRIGASMDLGTDQDDTGTGQDYS